jgi:hypothetical protein
MKNVKTGQIKWREEELSHKEFIQLNIEEKKKYIKFLLSLDFEDISFNDEQILNLYLPLNENNISNRFKNLTKVKDVNQEITSIINSVFDTTKN